MCECVFECISFQLILLFSPWFHFCRIFGEGKGGSFSLFCVPSVCFFSLPQVFVVNNIAED